MGGLRKVIMDGFLLSAGIRIPNTLLMEHGTFCKTQKNADPAGQFSKGKGSFEDGCPQPVLSCGQEARPPGLEPAAGTCHEILASRAPVS